MSAESLNNFCAITYIWNVLRCHSGPESFYISQLFPKWTQLVVITLSMQKPPGVTSTERLSHRFSCRITPGGNIGYSQIHYIIHIHKNGLKFQTVNKNLLIWKENIP